VKDGIERLLDALIGRLNSTVDRIFEKHGFNRKTLSFDEKLDGISEASSQGLPALEASAWCGQAVPPCPVCGTIPHNWTIHEEWRHLPGTKSPDKVAADREAYPAHECVDRPNLPCPACLKWTGDGFFSVKSKPQCFPGIDVTELK
jgi:hypothetical protein